MVQCSNANQAHLLEHVPDVFDGDVVIFSAARNGNGNNPSHLQNWRPYVAGGITEHSVDCTHHEMLTSGSLNIYGEQLKAFIRSLRRRCGEGIPEVRQNLWQLPALLTLECIN